MPEKISLLFPNRQLEFKKLSDTTLHDLGMDAVIRKLSNKQTEQIYIMNVMRLMTNDEENARYRADIFGDIVDNRKMREEIIAILDRINFLKDYGSFKHDHDHDPKVWDLLHRLGELSDYISGIEALYKCLDDADISSKGLISLKEYVSKLHNDNGFAGLKEDISGLKADTEHLKSVTVGINLNERFEACGIGIISLNSKPFTKSGIVGHFIDKVSGKDNIQDGNEWNEDYRYDEFTAKKPDGDAEAPVIPAFSPLALMSIKSISENDDSIRSVTNYMDEITERMLSKTVRHLRDVLAKYTTLTITDITDLMPEIIYYIRWAEYIEKLMAKGFKFSKPEPVGAVDESAVMEAHGIYNMKLLENESISPDNVVTNDLDFSREHTLYVLTGANRGGKTTITQAVGQLFFMAQGGIYVTGTGFKYSPADSIYTHFPADEDKTMDLGRLGEECKRFRQLYKEATKNSLLLLNETFSTTSFEEGYYIARDCVKAVLGKGIRTIYNTHMHKLALDIDEINNESKNFHAASLVVESEEGKRSYKIVVAPPPGRSYARDIAEKYGVTFEALTCNDADVSC